MPPSEPKPASAQPAGQSLAIAAEVLYLVNLLLVPGVAFMLLLFLYFKHVNTAPPLARCHLRQTFVASIWAGIILVIVNLAIIMLGGYTSSWTWVVVVLYFTICHASLVLVGSIGLARAMAGQNFRYPLLGRPCDALQ